MYAAAKKASGPTLLLASLLATLLLAGLCPLTLVGSAPAPPIGSGEETDDVAAEDFGPAVLNPVALAKLIGREAASLQNKLCENHGVCDNSMEMLAENNLQLPKITTKDRCFSSGFQKNKCLNKIHHDLLIFEIYLLHVKETFRSERSTLESIEYKTNVLTGAIKRMMKRSKTESDDKETNTQITQVRKSENLWIQKVTNRLILQAFIDCIQKTARAVRYIGTFHGGKKI
ncbi:interleukin-6 [Xenopus laevis]|uniref:Interleukin-6 n=2 Tax=Xenopus laevis TaxID=8355 RepID=A0A8J1KW63_XENLA|nr:interleukin-6 [Xenopus laevis]